MSPEVGNDRLAEAAVDGLAVDDATARRLRRAAVLLGAGVLLAAVVGFFLLFRFADANRDRDLGQWRDRLAVSAESRAAAVDDWIAGNRDRIKAIAGNPTLEFYLTERAAVGDPAKVTDGAARLAIIRTYLLFSAEQNGFAAAPGGAEISANIPRPRRAGLALIDADGKALVATNWMPEFDAILAAYKAAVPKKGDVYIHGLYAGEAGEPTLGFVAPVHALDGGAVLGHVVGIRLAGDIYGRLTAPGATGPGTAGDGAAMETVLLRAHDGRVDYLTASDKAAFVGKSAPLSDKTLAAAEVVAAPGLFTKGRDELGGQARDVLASGVALKTVPWVAMSMVDADAALKDIIARRNATLTIFGLVIICLSGAALLLWRYGASLRAAAAMVRAEAMATRFSQLSSFLRGVSDAQPTMILAFDADGKCRFANKRAADAAGLDGDLTGKTARAIFGLPLGPEIEDGNREALLLMGRVTRSQSLELANGRRQILKAEHLPLAHIEDGNKGKPGVLLVLEDVTALVTERERREDNLRQLVTTLAGVVDSRDPFAARQSRWVAELAGVIAKDMGLDEVSVETAEVAGALLNLGKVLVPRELLTRTSALSPAELEDVRHSLQKSADLLEGVAFNGPVVATIRQAQAHWDGSGLPQGLGGEDILVTARILMVANAFVGMISARAHRDPLPIEAAIGMLLDRAGTVFDRRPVVALVNYLENQGGRAIWEQRSQETLDGELPLGE